MFDVTEEHHQLEGQCLSSQVKYTKSVCEKVKRSKSE